MTMVSFRPLAPSDVDPLYAICLATGDSGEDATHLYKNPRLMGHIYAGPYAQLCPELCFVAEDEDGVGGYVIGTTDTRAFEQRMERDWWPALRAQYPEPQCDPATWNQDQRRCYMFHHPRSAPEEVVRDYPAHMHMNLVPRLQGRGIGSALCEHWIAEAQRHGVQAVHIGTGFSNPRAMAFWQSRGFMLLQRTANLQSSDTVWYGRKLEHAPAG